MITYQAESIEKILDELKPLLEKHWEEVAWYKEDIKLNPDYDRYLQLDLMGLIHAVTVRDDGKLVGYNINFINNHPHYKDHTYAVNDIIFLSPEYRKPGLASTLILITEKLLKEIGVSVVTIHMKTDHTFEGLMDHTGFERQEYIYSKKL